MTRIRKFRGGRAAATVVTLMATTVATMSVGAAPAFAATSAQTVVAQLQPTIYPSTAGQPAGDEVVTTTAAPVNIGDSLTLKVDDNDITPNCLATTDFIEFAAPPTLTVTAPATGAPTYSVVLASSPGACTVAGKKDQVVITATTSGAQGSFTLSGIEYTTGSTLAAGPVTVTASGSGTITDTDASNAVVSRFKVTGNTPPVGVAADSTGSPISDITIQEFVAGEIPTGFVCATIITGQGVFSSAGTVSASGGGASASGAHLGGNAIESPTSLLVSFANTGATSSPATYTLTGLTFDAGPGVDGRVAVKVGSSTVDRDTACSNADLSTSTVITFVTDLNRLGGGDRFATAQIIFDDRFACLAPSDNGNDTAIIARGDNFPDALAASYLAGFEGTGILLVNTNSIPASTLNALRLEGINNVIIVGGTTAISTGVENQLKATPQHDCGGAVLPDPLNVSRIGGLTRYNTAQDVAEFPGLGNPGLTDLDLDSNNSADCQPVVTAIVASGENFPDALAAGPLAYSGNTGGCVMGHELPLLLTTKDSLSSAAAAGLINLNVRQVILMGGTAAVSAATEAQIAALGINVIRVAGTTRQLTAAALVTLMADDSNIGYTDGNIGVARGDNFPDALTLGPAAGAERRGVVLTDSPTSLGSAAAGVLANLSSKVNLDGFSPDCTDDVHLAGGTAALSAGVAQEVLNATAAQNPSPLLRTASDDPICPVVVAK